MEEADKEWMMIRMVGECFFWYPLTRVVSDKGLKTILVVVVVPILALLPVLCFMHKTQHQIP